MSRQAPAVVVALSTVVLLSGCVAADPVVTPVPVPSATPPFASDEEALKAATDAYAAYLKVSDAILADGGAEPDRIDAVAAAALAKQQKAGYKKYAAKGYQQIGPTLFDTVTLEQYHPTDLEGVEFVTIYVCADVSSVDVLDGSGASVVSAERPDRTPLEVSFDWRARSKSLVTSSQVFWPGEDFC